MMNRSDKFREKLEEKIVNENINGLEIRLGNDFWQLTLRSPVNQPDVKFKCYKKASKGSDLQFIKVEGNLYANYMKLRHPNDHGKTPQDIFINKDTDILLDDSFET